MARTSISAGEIIYDILSNDGQVSKIARKVFPIMVDTAIMPYVAYRCAGMVQQPAKQGVGADTLNVEVACLAADYDEVVSLAEAVREALDHRQHAVGSLTMRSCTLTDREEQWLEDANAFMERLVFNIKI